ncbi:hypothetical protein [Achromobacter phage Motura]|uniref:Uncharacterized protein n=1 Tax=Achromobacter phage Motura TaxID=2591403 RepID=A0A514CSQ4_9CAUD|nr:hypothetical protein H1O15_gp297 [Achromobacter phage Motura]QDH83509.1 hypothetical protein [Achromobacter phage Motura]
MTKAMRVHLKALAKGTKWLENNLGGEWACIGAAQPIRTGYLIYNLVNHEDRSGQVMADILEKKFEIVASVETKRGKVIYFRHRKVGYPISLFIHKLFMSVTLYSEFHFAKTLIDVRENPRSKLWQSAMSTSQT